MNFRKIMSAALLGILVPGAAFAAGSTPGTQPVPPTVSGHSVRQMAKMTSSSERQCAVLEARFDKALAAWKGADQHRRADARALRREGGDFCQQGNNRAAVKYLEGAINVLAGRHVV